jgi:coenzyme F420-0:L-glutamate ligase
MLVKAIKTRIFKQDENLVQFVVEHSEKIPDKSILVVTSKIVALSEGRVVEFKDKAAKAKLIKEESEMAIATKEVWMTIKDGMILASAGIDESNANGRMILLPKDSFKSADILRKKLMKKFGLKQLGVLITDSRLMPLRSGALGVALGYAGFKGLKSYIGTKDIFGRVLAMSQTDVADSLATAAVLCMGEGKEQQPLALITNAPVTFTDKVKKKELVIAPEKDIYAPFFKNLKSNAKRK